MTNLKDMIDGAIKLLYSGAITSRDDDTSDVTVLYAMIASLQQAAAGRIFDEEFVSASIVTAAVQDLTLDGAARAALGGLNDAFPNSPGDEVLVAVAETIAEVSADQEYRLDMALNFIKGLDVDLLALKAALDNRIQAEAA